jgi:hypothetical protein
MCPLQLPCLYMHAPAAVVSLSPFVAPTTRPPSGLRESHGRLCSSSNSPRFYMCMCGGWFMMRPLFCMTVLLPVCVHRPLPEAPQHFAGPTPVWEVLARIPAGRRSAVQDAQTSDRQGRRDLSQSLPATSSHSRRYTLLCHCDLPQGTGAALMHPAFPRFLDRWASESWDSPTCTITWKIIQQMSESYLSKAMQGCAILARCHMCHGCGNVLVSCAWLQTLMTRPP